MSEPQEKHSKKMFFRVLIKKLNKLVLTAEKKFDSLKQYVDDYRKMKAFVERLSAIDTRAAKEVGLLNKAMKPIIKIKTKWKPPASSYGRAVQPKYAKRRRHVVLRSSQIQRQNVLSKRAGRLSRTTRVCWLWQ